MVKEICHTVNDAVCYCTIMSERSDVLVLGAGIVGVSVALHLQQRGCAVTLLDRSPPGSGTSYGNAGLIERSSVVPYAFPRRPGMLLRLAANAAPAVRWRAAALPGLLPWLVRYWWHSAPARLARAGAAMLPLIERSVAEHQALLDAAGPEAQALVRPGGWVEVYRSAGALVAAGAEARRLAAYALRYEMLDAAGLRGRLPALVDGAAVGGIHWLDPLAVTDPGGLTRAYAALFQRRGGRVVRGDARSLGPAAGGWRVATAEHELWAPAAVVALGPWSGDVLRPLGYRLPLAVKRGYHRHFAADGTLPHPLCDSDAGFVLAPMAAGLRLTTGVELADRDAPPDPRQLDRAEAAARRLVALGPRQGPDWVGARPCLPDMRPVIGPAPNHPGLWLALGHAHHGLTLGPVTGRLLAEAMCGEATVADLAAYAAERFS